MKRLVTLLLMLTIIGATAGLAAAQEPERQDRHWNESPMYGTWEFNAGLMLFTDDGYKDVYGDKGIAFYHMSVSYKLIHHLELVANLGYGFAEGNGISPADKSKTAEKYKLHIAPGGLGLQYRFNFAYDQPVVPYVGAAGIASYWFEERLDSSWKNRSYNYGAQGFAGLMFLLDNIEKRASGALEAEWGINNSYLFYEFRYTNLDNFGEEDVVDLSSQLHSLGILFEF
jgi:hypothetical protein